MQQGARRGHARVRLLAGVVLGVSVAAFTTACLPEPPPAPAADAKLLSKPDKAPSSDKPSSTTTPGGESFPSTRDIYRWPFAASSIWNMPIGSAAAYAPAGLDFANAWGGRVGLDLENISVDRSFPVRMLTAASGISGMSVHVDPQLSDAGTQNDTSAFLSADNPNLVWMGQPLTLALGGSPTWTWTSPTTAVPLDGDGRAGSHGGSHLSSLGGSIRPDELRGSAPIRHALKINMYARKYLSPAGSPNGYRWPAYNADGYFREIDPVTGRSYYDGPIPALRMGSLLALRPDVDLSFVTHPFVAKLAWTLENYGAYVVDDAGWDVYDLSMDVAAWRAGEWPTIEVDPSFHAELQRVFTLLNVVDNNAPAAIGGGGTPRQPLAPPFAPR